MHLILGVTDNNNDNYTNDNNNNNARVLLLLLLLLLLLFSLLFRELCGKNAKFNRGKRIPTVITKIT